MLHRPYSIPILDSVSPDCTTYSIGGGVAVPGMVGMPEGTGVAAGVNDPLMVMVAVTMGVNVAVGSCTVTSAVAVARSITSDASA